MNPWRVVRLALQWSLIGFVITLLWGFICWVEEREDLWDAERRFADRYSRPEMWTAWTCSCGRHNKSTAMCGSCGGDRPHESH